MTISGKLSQNQQAEQCKISLLVSKHCCLQRYTYSESAHSINTESHIHCMLTSTS